MSSESTSRDGAAAIFTRPIALLLIAGTLGGCAATTTVRVVPSPQAPLCERSANAKVLWAPHWRPDQKDVAAREEAAAQGIARFFSESGCFSSAVIQRLVDPSAAAVEAALAEARTRDERLVMITVRELGPIVKIGTTLAIVEGATEAVIDLSEYRPPDAVPRRTFTVHWRSGGAGIVKGVASLPQDMQAALSAGMQPLTR